MESTAGFSPLSASEVGLTEEDAAPPGLTVNQVTRRPTGHVRQTEQPCSTTLMLSSATLVLSLITFIMAVSGLSAQHNFVTETRFARLHASVRSLSSQVGASTCVGNETMGSPMLVYGTSRYQIVRSRTQGGDTGVVHPEARAFAMAHCYNSVPGRLATVPSAAVNDFLLQEMNVAGVSNAWLGGTDESEEGVWQWLDAGQQARPGTVFWIGDYSGSSMNGRFNDWSRRNDGNGGEPNSDFGYDDEDCLALNLNQYAGSTGHWNDAPCLWGGYDGFIVEYPETA